MSLPSRQAAVTVGRGSLAVRSAAILTDRKKISVGATEAALHAHLEGSVER